MKLFRLNIFLAILGCVQSFLCKEVDGVFVISSDFNDGDDIHTDFSPPLTNYFSTFFSQVASRLEQMYLEMNKFISRLTKVSDLELDEKLVVFTGRTGIVEVVDLNNPDNTCSNLQQFPRQFYSPISGVIGNTLVTCESHGNCYSLGNDGVWSQGPSLKVPRYGAPSVSWGNGDRILIMGGVKAKPVNGTWTETTSIEEVDFSRQTSKEIGNLPVNIYYACATNQNGKIHVIGGIQDDGWASRRTWISKVENFDWSQGPDLIDRRRWLACAYVPKWNITLVTGGQGSFFAEILTNNQFIRGPDMSLNDRAMNPYYGNSLVSLPSGDGVIAIGGIGERLEGPCCKYPTRLFLLKFTTRNFNEHIWVELSQRPKSPRQDFDTRMFFLNLNAFNCTTLG